ncbi:MAG: hypothetical protein J6A76_03025 [Oscillospiraceae bacterium]|nr:hypothetical protein [Oscillospiraceae bacterium]
MKYYVKFLPIGERNIEPPENKYDEFDDKSEKRLKTRLDMIWSQLSDSAVPSGLVEKAAYLFKRREKNEHR